MIWKAVRKQNSPIQCHITCSHHHIDERMKRKTQWVVFSPVSIKSSVPVVSLTRRQVGWGTCIRVWSGNCSQSPRHCLDPQDWDHQLMKSLSFRMSTWYVSIILTSVGNLHASMLGLFVLFHDVCECIAQLLFRLRFIVALSSHYDLLVEFFDVYPLLLQHVKHSDQLLLA